MGLIGPKLEGDDTMGKNAGQPNLPGAPEAAFDIVAMAPRPVASRRWAGPWQACHSTFRPASSSCNTWTPAIGA